MRNKKNGCKGHSKNKYETYVDNDKKQDIS